MGWDVGEEWVRTGGFVIPDTPYYFAFPFDWNLPGLSRVWTLACVNIPQRVLIALEFGVCMAAII